MCIARYVCTVCGVAALSGSLQGGHLRSILYHDQPAPSFVLFLSQRSPKHFYLRFYFIELNSIPTMALRISRLWSFAVFVAILQPVVSLAIFTNPAASPDVTEYTIGQKIDVSWQDANEYTQLSLGLISLGQNIEYWILCTLISPFPLTHQ
jgi:hypothetical protein